MSSAGKGYIRLSTDPSSSDTFVQDSFQQQNAILENQDEALERVGESLRTLKNMSSQIGTEIGEQSEMLDELGEVMSRTDDRMNNVMKKLAKLSHLEDDDRQCTAIFVLIGLIILLMIILIL